ncbi:hypothetical protein RB594_008627 [Gaeumannomyces avenae]
MAWTFALVSLLLSFFYAAALSSPLSRRGSVFAIANLSVEAVPLSHRVQYFFLVTPDSAIGANAECSALVTSLNESVRSVPPTACAGPGLTFEWRQLDDGGAELRVVRNLSSPSTPARPPLLEAGGHRIGRTELAVVAVGTEFEHQAYVGPANFSMSVRVLEGVD